MDLTRSAVKIDMIDRRLAQHSIFSIKWDDPNHFLQLARPQLWCFGHYFWHRSSRRCFSSVIRNLAPKNDWTLLLFHFLEKEKKKQPHGDGKLHFDCICIYEDEILFRSISTKFKFLWFHHYYSFFFISLLYCKPVQSNDNEIMNCSLRIIIIPETLNVQEFLVLGDNILGCWIYSA